MHLAQMVIPRRTKNGHLTRMSSCICPLTAVRSTQLSAGKKNSIENQLIGCCIKGWIVRKVGCKSTSLQTNGHTEWHTVITKRFLGQGWFACIHTVTMLMLAGIVMLKPLLTNTASSSVCNPCARSSCVLTDEVSRGDTMLAPHGPVPTRLCPWSHGVILVLVRHHTVRTVRLSRAAT